MVMLPVNQVLQGDCLDVLKGLPDNSADCCITDPPYGLGEVKNLPALLQSWIEGKDGAEFNNKKGFMGKEWDCVPSPLIWKEVFRVLKPGGHLLAFAGTRTQDLMGISIRLAGFELRDTIEHLSGSTLLWSYGSGFPKGLNVSKQLDAMLGAERGKIKHLPRPITSGTMSGKMDSRPWIEKSREIGYHETDDNIPISDLAKKWEGWNVALKPSQEPILLFRKPLERGLSVAGNVTKWGTGAINIGACRVETDEIRPSQFGGAKGNGKVYGNSQKYQFNPNDSGRWPSNLLLSHSLFCTDGGCDPSCPIFAMDAQSGLLTSGEVRPLDSAPKAANVNFKSGSTKKTGSWGASEGGASRFFPNFSYSPEELDELYFMFRYFSKPSQIERNTGLESLPERVKVYNGQSGNSSKEVKPVEERFTTVARNVHPTVKSQALMSWLCKLVTPPNGVILDPFAGSGSTLVAAYKSGFSYIGIEREELYCEIARLRVDAAKGLFKFSELEETA